MDLGLCKWAGNYLPQTAPTKFKHTIVNNIIIPLYVLTVSKSRFKMKQSCVAQLKTNVCLVNPSVLRFHQIVC